MGKRAVKVIISGDTTKYEEAVKKADRSTKKFAKGTQNATNSIASAFGVNLGPVNTAIDSMQNGFQNFNRTIKGSKGSAGVFKIAMAIIKKALISTGIGAIIIAFGALLSYFTRTQEGADAVKRVFAGLGAVMDVIVDRLAALGKKMVWAFSHPKEAVKGLWETIKKLFINRFTAIPKIIDASMKLVGAILRGEGKEAVKDLGYALNQALTGLDEKQTKKIIGNVKSLGKEIREESKAAMALKKEEQQLEKDQIAFITRKAQLEADIAKNRLKSREEDKYSAEERLQATKNAMEARKQLSAEEIDFTKRKISILERQQALANNMNKDNEELQILRGKAINLEAQQSTGLITLMRDYNRLTREVHKNADATRSLNKVLAESIVSKKVVQVSQEVTSTDGTKIPVTIEPQLETEKLNSFAEQTRIMAEQLVQNYKNAFTDISPIIRAGTENVLIGVSTLIGKLAQGGNFFKGFTHLVASTFADMAIQVGKIAIATGVATLGIKAALKSLNGAVAIAAGVALVALGTAVKGSLSSVASGSSGGSSSPVGGNFDVRQFPTPNSSLVQVQVSGEFRQKAGDLVATIKQESQRQRILT
ncbi:hypothetical protein K4L44_05820 [Halosquirtibacter laminarini]|uniref:Uncharacterized protein n=1 Tax=Halosquirtibacter laminarini TaxID=3374600 RepID=A0AC61NPU2_9BACT|nr:hypothetical protein K4L44_05820 [Prolixibacteraceae bacterium]